MAKRGDKNHWLEGCCPCGTSRIALARMPRHRFLCHCTICQNVYPGDYADATITRADAVRLLTPETVTFGHYKANSPLERGVCTSCAHPVVAFMKMPAMPDLAFVPAAMLPKNRAQPRPTRHIFYGTRKADVIDDLPKTSGDLASMAVLLPDFLTALFRR
ncbi:MAG: GFA family protein [Porphyrobacter sp.]|nr:GFA family protein [Porphyrobacter sp.]